MKRKLIHRFEDIISVDNLLSAWCEFVRGKRGKPDVQEFSLRLMDNILQLHSDLRNKTYRHGGYATFNINDPKPRQIHKAAVRDRLGHHAIYRVLYYFYHQIFIADSFSCRLGKGTHKALNRFRAFASKVGQNNTRTCWILKCDIKKFFASVDHDVLLTILRDRIPDEKIIWLLEQVIDSFHAIRPGLGLPLGNLTSQLLANVYMNEFDQFVKQKLRVKHYLRYADDFVILSPNRSWLVETLSATRDFLQNKLRLLLHPDKISIKTLASGVDLLGWVHSPDHRVLRTSTRHRMIRKLQKSFSTDRLNSYLGLLKHGNTSKIQRCILDTARSMGIEVAGYLLARFNFAKVVLMTKVIIPKNLAKMGDLVIIPRQEYDEFLSLKKIIPTFQASRGELSVIKQGQKSIERGDYVTWRKLKRELADLYRRPRQETA